MRMSLTPPPHTEGNAVSIAAMHLLEVPETLEQLERTIGDEPHPLPGFECLKSLDDLDEEADEEDEDDEDDDDLGDEEDEDDLDEDYDEDEDEDEDEEDEDEDDDGGVKPLKMASPHSRSSHE